MPGILFSDKSNFSGLLAKKSGFISSVYASLALQIAITTIVALYLRQHPATFQRIQKYFILWFILSLIVIITLAATSLPTPVKFILLCCFSLLMGLNCIAASTKVPESVIKASLMATMGVFVMMTLFGLGLASLGINLGFLTFVLFSVLIALLIAFIVMMFVPVPGAVHKAILAIGITLFSIYVAYDTNIMLQRDYQGNVIQASINLYLDLINIFTEIIAFEQQ